MNVCKTKTESKLLRIISNIACRIRLVENLQAISSHHLAITSGQW